MNDKTLEILNHLAEKFGTTVEHLWGVLVKQAAICAVTETVVAIAMVALWIAIFRFVRAKTSVPYEGPLDFELWRDEAAFFAWAVVVVGLLIVIVQVYSAITTGVTALLNPEYWALNKVLP